MSSVKHRIVTQLTAAISLSLYPEQAQHLAAYLAGKSGFCFSYAHVLMIDNSRGTTVSGFTFGVLIPSGHIAMTSFEAMNVLGPLFQSARRLISHGSKISISPEQKTVMGDDAIHLHIVIHLCRELFVIW